VFLPSAFLSGITGQFFRQFALTISASMVISAINAMTMTPARAASIFAGRKPGEHGHQGKEALPWWSFAIAGGLVSLWLLPTGLPMAVMGFPVEYPESPAVVQAILGYAQSALLFLPGAIGGGIVGWFAIGVVNRFLGRLFRGFNVVFDRATHLYGKT